MWELQEFVGEGTSLNILLQILVLNKTFVISQPGVIKFGGSGCDVDLRPAVCSEVANMFVIGTDTNCVVCLSCFNKHSRTVYSLICRKMFRDNL